jgi:hypothetical protein
MNTATHDGGNAVWSGSSFLNFDDSPATSECYLHSPQLPNAENYCSTGNVYGPVTAASQSGFLPPGNTLSFLFSQNGGGICHIGSTPNINEPTDFTYCAREYRRWDASSHVPQNSLEQQKILTSPSAVVPFGQDLGSGLGNCPNPAGCFITLQLSMDVGGDIHTRFDGDYWNPPIDFSSLGNFSECQSNLCRFEVCMDVSSTGEGRARLRMTRVPPGSGLTTTVNKPVGAVLHPGGVNVVGVAGGGDAMYGQCSVDGVSTVGCAASGRNYISYNSHYIILKTRPENRSFWPGPACEVEGGCSSTQVPTAPTGLATR